MIFLSPSVQGGAEDESAWTDFDIISKLGQGAFGKVYKVAHKRNRLTYAIKELSKSQLRMSNMVEQIANEVKIMYSLDHPYIVKLLNHFEDDHNICLIVELASGGQMYQVLFNQPQKRFPEKKVATYMYQLILALQYIHSKNIMHRDIKPENIIFDANGNIKLTDFGWSNFMKPDTFRETFCGTLDYLAPEMLDQTHQHGYEVDIWSVGVLTYELLTSKSPFSPTIKMNDPTFVENETKNNIRKLNYQFPANFPQLAKDFVQKILVIKPEDRISLKNMLVHPWITTNAEMQKPIEISKKVFEQKQVQLPSSLNEQIFDNINMQKGLTQDEIMQFTRMESIVNKDFDESFKKLPNYQKNLTPKDKDKSPQVASNSAQDKQIQQLLVQLQNENKELKVSLQKKIQENQAMKDAKSQNEKGSEEVSFLRSKLKISETNYYNLKRDFDTNWQTTIEKEQKIKNLELQLQQKDQLIGQVEKYKAKLQSVQSANVAFKDQLVELKMKISEMEADSNRLSEVPTTNPVYFTTMNSPSGNLQSQDVQKIKEIENRANEFKKRYETTLSQLEKTEFELKKQKQTQQSDNIKDQSTKPGQVENEYNNFYNYLDQVKLKHEQVLNGLQYQTGKQN